jgi:hypothetical protein
MQKSFKFLFLILGMMTILAACDVLNFSASDQEALDSLREAGSDLSKAHPFDFYLYHNHKSGAQQICAELNQAGFQGSVQEGAIEGEWLCLARLNLVPSIEKLSELDQLFEELIRTYGGEYDGWETIVVPE